MRKPEVAAAQPIELDDDRLRQRRERDRHARRRRHVADAELQRAERRMRPQIPPDFLARCRCSGAGRAVSRYSSYSLHESNWSGMPERGKRRKTVVRYDFRPGVASLPERRAGRERQQVRQEVARFVQQLDRARAVGHRDVDVQAEDEQRPRELLQLFDDVLVALAGRDDLILPARKRVRAGGRDAQADAFGALRQLAADVVDLVLELVDVGADFGADLDDRLVQLALELIAERRRRPTRAARKRAIAAPTSPGRRFGILPRRRR